MELKKVNLAYFSATGTTAKIVTDIASGTGVNERRTIHLTDPCDPGDSVIVIASDEIVIFGIPVFSGRVPQIARQGMEMIKGNNTPAIIACVYGNRAFDDALLEMKDIVESNGFYVISAGAFVAQHSIFPKLAHGRPDSADLMEAKEFGANSIKILTTQAAISSDKPLVVPGNYPYRAIHSLPLTPTTNRRCNLCGLCAAQCPVQAIDSQNPKKIDKNKCIACAHCISICPKESKKFRGLLYWVASRKFTKKFSQRKESCLIYR